MNDDSAKPLTPGRMIPSGTNSQTVEVSIIEIQTVEVSIIEIQT